MCAHEHESCNHIHCSCCPSTPPHCDDASGISRRSFLGGVGSTALGTFAMTGLSWSALSAAEKPAQPCPDRKALVVKPIFTHGIFHHRDQTSWRPWGGVQTEDDAKQETDRIRGELKALCDKADFPLKMLPVTPVLSKAQLANAKDLAQADTVLIYAAAAGDDIFDAVREMGKDIIIFVRHQSGPLYLWYEIVSPRYLRAHTDRPAKEGVTCRDVVVDSQDEILMRLRALCGLKNTMGTKIVAVGGPSGWAHRDAYKLAQERWKLDIHTLKYPELGKLIAAARKDPKAVAQAKQKTDAYLKQPGVTLETKREFVEKAFVMDDIFRRVMAEVGARALTLNQCMGTIMKVSGTTGCMNLTWLNDDGFVAFCESDFVVIASGILMHAITGRPPFLNDPTYPHDGIITLAHCTAPRRMNGKDLEPARIMTHFESDYGAAPKVEFTKGQKVTVVDPDFDEQCWLGMTGTVADVQFLPICRSQFELKVDGCCDKLAEKMRGFHWMVVYGDCLRELQYALSKTPVGFETLV